MYLRRDNLLLVRTADINNYQTCIRIDVPSWPIRNHKVVDSNPMVGVIRKLVRYHVMVGSCKPIDPLPVKKWVFKINYIHTIIIFCGNFGSFSPIWYVVLHKGPSLQVIFKIWKNEHIFSDLQEVKHFCISRNKPSETIHVTELKIIWVICANDLWTLWTENIVINFSQFLVLQPQFVACSL